ncbi:hypothetical protein A3I48_01525 [Candidatus Daviesbacteria bacterium RIFCSPLOWO2_02_FULL_36_7]|uniref:Uncharacterized protein n=1 Tax=Candidatus Daviesbacteria bacterium RIFCSPLOWO2_02_FULL_36_7 TaxID=1797792 RepID=A0A1F5MH45_9BACT|nr:MAG: hypothetical protein A3I48_01525 [Candidatus Daviesbacteria bacterium RIFCSPLOWO2_02_FULL_36_7]
MDQRIAEYLDNLIKEYLNNPRFSNLNEEQKINIATTLEGVLYKAAVEELINRLNADQLAQIANLDLTSPQMEAKLEEFAATIPDFLSMLEERFQEELTNFQSVN